MENRLVAEQMSTQSTQPLHSESSDPIVVSKENFFEKLRCNYGSKVKKKSGGKAAAYVIDSEAAVRCAEENLENEPSLSTPHRHNKRTFLLTIMAIGGILLVSLLIVVIALCGFPGER